MSDRLLPIKSAREASQRLGLRRMIVLQELETGQWGYTSYGRTKALCEAARALADRLLETIEDGEGPC